MARRKNSCCHKILPKYASSSLGMKAFWDPVSPFFCEMRTFFTLSVVEGQTFER